MRIVRVTAHALEQHTTRWPGDFPTVDDRYQSIAADVTAAIAEGRMSPKEPSFTPKGATIGRRERGRRRALDRSIRFVWTMDRSRVYIIDRSGNEVVVVTSLPANDDTRAA